MFTAEPTGHRVPAFPVFSEQIAMVPNVRFLSGHKFLCVVAVYALLMRTVAGDELEAQLRSFFGTLMVRTRFVLS
mgnify:CR=1 FL=1